MSGFPQYASRHRAQRAESALLLVMMVVLVTMMLLQVIVVVVMSLLHVPEGVR